MTHSNNGTNLTDDQTANLLRASLVSSAGTRESQVGVMERGGQRPIDALLERLASAEDDGWLDQSLGELFTSDELAMMQEPVGGRPHSTNKFITLKERAKELVVEAATERIALAALAGYCLTVAAGLVHVGKLLSTRPAREWGDLFADLAAVVPPPRRDLLINAAEMALKLAEGK